MTPIRILFTIPNFITAGSGQVLINIVECLDKTHFEPFICVSRKGGSPLEHRAAALGIPIIESPFDVPVKPYFNLLQRSWKVAQSFRSYQFKIWHSFHYSDTYTESLVARFAGVRTQLYTKKSMGWGSRAWLLKSYLATRIVADNTDMLKEMFDRPGLRKKVVYIPHGVNTEIFRSDIDLSLQLRSRQRVPSDAPVIAVVAHLVPVKGHPTLLDALPKVPGAHLWLAGRLLDAEYTDLLKKQIELLQLTDRVHFLGNIENIPALLSEADIVVLPTWARWRMEGCPVALIEAMSCGKACVATDIPGARDLIVHQESGLLVPPEDVDALVSAINLLVQNPELRHRYGAAARLRVKEHFTIEREVAQHEALYKKLLQIN